MTIDITLFSNQPSDEFDMAKFYIEKETAIISFKSYGEEDDITIVNVDVEDLKKLAKIINDINL